MKKNEFNPWLSEAMVRYITASDTKYKVNEGGWYSIVRLRSPKRQEKGRQERMQAITSANSCPTITNVNLTRI